MILKTVGERHRTHLEAAVERAFVAEQRQDMRAEAAPRSLLNSDEEFVAGGEVEDEVAVEGFREAGVGDRGR